MVEELKAVLEMVGDLSGIALWVIAAVIGYKAVITLATTGTVFVLLRLLITRLFNYLQSKSGIIITDEGQTRVVDENAIKPICMDDARDGLLKQLHRLRHVQDTYGSGGLRFIHASHVDWLKEQIDKKLAENEKKANR